MFDLVPFRRRRNRGGLVDIDDFFDSFFNSLQDFTSPHPGSFKTDVKERENEYIIEAELPGVKKDNIDIELNEDCLTITANNNEIIEEEKDNYIRRERRSGKFQRSFYIKDIKEDEIEACYEDGILKIKLPKKHPGKRSRKIDIN